MRRLVPLVAALALGPASAFGASVSVTAFDARGRVLDSDGLLRYVAPAESAERGLPAAHSGLFAADSDGRPLAGRPWWSPKSPGIVWTWEEAPKAVFSLPWPVPDDGFSTVLLDNGGKGFIDGQSFLLNEEAAKTAYRRMQDSLKRRLALKPPYRPSEQVARLVSEAKDAMAKATAVNGDRKRAKLFDRALAQVSFAWQQLLFDHGKQTIKDEKLGARVRFGLSIDETLSERIHDFDRIADQLAESGAGWVRLVFTSVPGDFAFAQDSSFALYDRFVDLLAKRKIRIMGSVLDSLLWPAELTPDAYQERARNLARRYKDRIRSWEVASEPNASWLGGKRNPLPPETVLLAVQKAVVAVKGEDPALETVATLHWWEGTAPETRYALFPWLDWAQPRGFGHGLDAVALSLYPHRHPVGLAFEPAFEELGRRFPDKKLMLGGWSFSDGRKLEGYWWLSPKNVKDARKDLLVLYLGTMAAIPNSAGGGFYWSTLSELLPPGKKPTDLYRLHKDTVDRLRR